MCEGFQGSKEKNQETREIEYYISIADDERSRENEDYHDSAR